GNAPSNCTAGTLTIRRKFTNSTGSPVTHLRFRVADITTKNTPGTGLADVRLLSSGDVTVYDSQSHQVQVRGTTVDDPPTQTSGGGLNSSAVAGAITLGSPLAAGDSINVQFVLGIVQGGTFRFVTNVEAVLGSATGQPSAPPTMDD